MTRLSIRLSAMLLSFFVGWLIGRAADELIERLEA